MRRALILANTFNIYFTAHQLMRSPETGADLGILIGVVAIGMLFISGLMLVFPIAADSTSPAVTPETK